MGIKKTDFSRHEKSTNHFWLMLSNYFVFINLFNCVSTSRPPYITRIIVTTCVSSSGIYKTRYMLQAYQADHLHFLVSAIQKQWIRRFHEGLSRPNLKSRYNKSLIVILADISKNRFCWSSITRLHICISFLSYWFKYIRFIKICPKNCLNLWDHYS